MTVERTRPDYGHSIVFGHTIRYLSASSIGSFDPNQEGGCHRRYWFEKIDGKKPPETTWQNRGTNSHSDIEHYLKTSENVLDSIVRHGMRFIPKPGLDLIIEEGFGDYKSALAARDRLIAGIGTREEVERHGLSFFGMPIMGAMDLRHRRGEWLDDAGVLQIDPPGTAEINDWKTTSNVEKWAKTPEGLVKTIQMPLYARATLHVWPETKFVRISHAYFGTKKRESRKVSVLLDLDTVYRRAGEIESVVASMVDVAKETDYKNIEPNLRACSDFRGCPHMLYCDRPQQSVSQLIGMRKGEPMAGLFEMMTKNGSNGAVAAPVAPPSDPVAVAREKISRGEMMFDPSGKIVFDKEGADTGWIQRPPTESELVAFTQTSPRTPIPAIPQAPPHIGAVNPPDAPAYDLVASAEPLSPEVIATIEDPEIKARAQEHAFAHAATKAVAAAAKGESGKAGGRCSAGGSLVSVDQQETVTRKKICPQCSKEFRIKDSYFSPDFKSITMPKHNSAKADLPAAISPPVVVLPPAPIPAPPVVVLPPAPIPAPPLSTLPPQTVQIQAKTVAQTDGITLFIDVAFEKGELPKQLEDYFLPMVRELEAKSGLHDLRWAPDRHDLAYGKWKGALAAFVRECPPQAGAYAVANLAASEIAAVVVEALRPLCSTVVRGR